MYGKSTIFNSLTGMNQHTGNWPGKTVENASGICNINGENILFVDIPGTYSIMSNSEEEEIARDYICFGKPNATVVILDATCLERNLNLVFQIMEITKNIVVCVNLLDEAKKKGIIINLKRLEKILGVPVVGTIARKSKTLENLKQTIYNVVCGNIKPNPNKIQYIPEIEQAISIIKKEIDTFLEDKYLTRWVSLKFIDMEEKILNSIKKNLGVQFNELSFEMAQEENEVEEINKDDTIKQNNLEKELNKVTKMLEEKGINKNNIREKIVESILIKAEEIVKKVVEYEKEKNYKRDRKIDKILTSKIWGIPIMILFLGIILWITIVGANYPSMALTKLFSWIEEKIVYVFNFLGSPAWLKSILIDGMYKTVTWVIAVMLPPMAIFFPMFTLLEDLGYLPRVAFNLDKYFKKACSSRKASINYVHGTWL